MPYPTSAVLASARSSALLLYSVVWFCAQNWQSVVSGASLASIWASYNDPIVVGGLLYIGLVPGALAGLLQAVGQSRVGTAKAQVFYSTASLWSALMTTLLLKSETLGAVGWMGGALIAGAGIAAGTSPAPATSPKSQPASDESSVS